VLSCGRTTLSARPQRRRRKERIVRTNYSFTLARLCAVAALVIALVSVFHLLAALAMPGVVAACVILLALALLLPI